jgi:hypothetical protein
MFQPRAQGGGEHYAEARPGQLELRVVLALPPGALGGEQRAHHGAAGPLDRREAIARPYAKEEWERAQHEITENELLVSPSR